MLLQKLLGNIVHRKTRQICDDLSANTYAQFFYAGLYFQGGVPYLHRHLPFVELNWSEVKNVKCTEIIMLFSLGQEDILKWGYFHFVMEQNFVNHNEVPGYKCLLNTFILLHILVFLF